MIGLLGGAWFLAVATESVIPAATLPCIERFFSFRIQLPRCLWVQFRAMGRVGYQLEPGFNVIWLPGAVNWQPVRQTRARACVHLVEGCPIRAAAPLKPCRFGRLQLVPPVSEFRGIKQRGEVVDGATMPLAVTAQAVGQASSQNTGIESLARCRP